LTSYFRSNLVSSFKQLRCAMRWTHWFDELIFRYQQMTYFTLSESDVGAGKRQ
jgi:hypothetical protein